MVKIKIISKLLLLLITYLISSCTDNGVITPPDSVLNVMAKSGDKNITINWDNVHNATSYNVYWANNSNVTQNSNKISVVENFYNHDNLTNGTTYYYRISALRHTEESQLSTEVHATPGIVNDTVVLLDDNFNDNILDSDLWYTTGNYVTEENGMVRILCNQTDKGGRLWSKPIKINDKGKIIVYTKGLAHASGNTTIDMECILYELETDTSTVMQRRVNWNYCNKGIGKEGFGFESNMVAPAWDKWINETIIYDIENGKAEYSYDNSDTSVITFSPKSFGYIKLFLCSFGYFTGHYTYYDYIKIVQVNE